MVKDPSLGPLENLHVAKALVFFPDFCRISPLASDLLSFLRGLIGPFFPRLAMPAPFEIPHLCRPDSPAW